MPKLLTVPGSLTELLQDPQRVKDAFALLNALVEMQVNLVPPGNVQALAPGNKPIRGEPPSLILPLPLAFRRRIDSASATAASAAATVNAMLDEFTASRINPRGA